MMSALRWNRLQQALAVGVLGWIGVRTFHLVQLAWPFTTDDAYITLRYARNLVEGHRVVWNPGEAVPVEGYSNFVFLLLGAAALKVGIDPMVFLKALSCAAIAPTCLLLYVLARRWLSPLTATLPAVLLASHTGLVYWAVSGLETTFYQLLVVAATLAFIVGLDARASEPGASVGVPAEAGRPVWSRLRLHLLAAALCFVAALARPEGPVVCVVLGLTALVDSAVRGLRARRRGDRVARDDAGKALLVTTRAFAFAFVIPYAIYFLWRFVHFGRLVPNTIYCKSHFSETGDPWTLIQDFWKQGKVFILLALVQDPRKLGARALPLFLLPVAYVAILHGADPMVGQFSRHFLAAIALLVVASSMGLVNLVALAALPFRWLARVLARRARSAAAVDAPWARIFPVLVDAALVLASLVIHARGQSWMQQEVLGTRDLGAHDRADHDDPWQLSPPYDLAWHATCYSRKTTARDDLGHYLERTLSPDQSYLIGDAGLTPYLTHASVIDAFCLNSREMTTAPISFDRKRFIDWVFARSPDRVVVHSSSPWQVVPREEYGFYPALVADPRFRSLYRQQPGAPVFYGEGFAYWVYERKP